MAEEEIVMGATSVIRVRDDDHQIHITMDQNDHDQIMMRSMAVVIGIRVKKFQAFSLFKIRKLHRNHGIYLL